MNDTQPLRPAQDGTSNPKHGLRRRHPSRRTLQVLAACLTLPWLAAATAQAATITVTNDADGGSGSLREALASSMPGDTIDFSLATPATIVLTTGALMVDRSVTVLGPGPDQLILDGNASSGVFHVVGGPTVSISGLTVTNSANEPAVHNDHSTLTIENCAVIANVATGVWNDAFNFDPGESGDADLTLRNCVIADNTGPNWGGGVLNIGLFGTAALRVEGCTFRNNFAGFGGGAIYNHASGNEAIPGSASATVLSSTLSANRAGGWGGGFYNSGGNFSYAYLIVVASTLDGNLAGDAGGGIYNDHGVAYVVTSTLSGNVAGFGGGGAIASDGEGFARFGSALTIVSASTFSGNSARTTIGGTIVNDALTVNSTDPGVANFEIGDTIVNADGSGSISNLAGTFTSGGYNLCNDGAGGLLAATGDVIDTDPLLGPLLDNGGPTFTHALLPGSPAIDQGKRDALPPFALGVDQRGAPRPTDDPDVGDAADGSDIGAYEAHNSPPVALCGDVTVAAATGCTADASVDDGSFDPDAGDTVTLTQYPGGPYELGTTTVTLTVTDDHGASSSCQATVTVQAATQLSYVGLKSYWVSGVDGTPTISARLSSVCGDCVLGATLDFWIDLNGDGIVDGGEVTAVAVDQNGVASLPIPQVGIFCVRVFFVGTEFCLSSETELAIIAVVSPDDLANGGGRHTRCDTSHGNPNVTFGFTTQWDAHANVYRGQLLVQNNNRWRVKGNVTAYAQTSASTGQATGLASVSWWDATLNNNEGGWARLASGIVFKVSFVDTGNTLTKKRNGAKPDAFALTYLGTSPIDPAILAAVGTPPVCTGPQPLRSGNVSIHP